ncbi:hypothetical protein [Deinococcus multiflagellatus]|uniref:KfrA N-terminal DNA-binding domain-containing protein n=1 Tax=Deinococcus multiflagellatus TaxID=1656887 RepID=A0ABW1ZG88_9DEIO|nr:hypothetical protein [Deinococcus multiflagellatus]MBZ9712155.1 hypothetical protein [Deinococcus multiflagellatus]
MSRTPTTPTTTIGTLVDRASTPLDPATARALTALDGPGWRGIITRTDSLITKALGKLGPKYRTEVSLINHVLDLQSFALSQVATQGLRAPAVVDREVLKLAQLLDEALLGAIRAAVEAETQVVRHQSRVDTERALVAQRADLQADMDNLSAAADQAQADATEYRRQLDAASAQLTREKAQHAQELARLQATLERERQATVNRERETRNRIHQLEHDLRVAQGLIGTLNRECERLEALLAAPAAPAPVPQPELGPTCERERMSLRVYLRALGASEPATPGQLQAWRAAYPGEAEQLAQLRAAMRSLVAA